MAVVEEGQLKGAFRGFKNRDTVFQFVAGHTWRQEHYKYQYHYAFMPNARVVERNGRYELEVDGMSDRVEVVKVR